MFQHMVAKYHIEFIIDEWHVLHIARIVSDWRIEISSQVIEYRDATGAKRGMTLVVDNLKSQGAKPLSAGKLGDQSAAFQYNYMSDDLELVLFSVVIQRRNLVSIVDVMGLSGGTSADDAYKLAQTAAGRLE